jgi:putative flippase GtrA
MKLQNTAFRFVLVGVLATLVHLIAGTILIQLRVAPTVANIFGFLTAFGFSFLGHHYYSFSGHANRLRETLSRFIWVAASGFGINQAILTLLLRAYPGTGASALVISTLTAAFATFLMSHLWAFRKHTGAKKVAGQVFAPPTDIGASYGEPPFSVSGVSFVRHKFRRSGGN